jgi:hypothetical protein
LQALDTVLGLNSIAMIPFGDKWTKADHVSDGCNSDRHAEDKSLEACETHVLLLSYAKPSELCLVLRPLA